MKEVRCRVELKDTIEGLYHKYATEIQRMCYLYLGDYQLAEDATQETFVKVYRNYAKFNHKSSEKTWITRIAINTCKDFLQRKLNQKWTVSDEEFEACLYETPQKKNVYSEVENTMLLTGAINRLDVAYREIVVLYYYQELSTKEIAGILKLPRTTVEFRLKEARKILKRELKGEYFNE